MTMFNGPKPALLTEEQLSSVRQTFLNKKEFSTNDVATHISAMGLGLTSKQAADRADKLVRLMKKWGQIEKVRTGVYANMNVTLKKAVG